MNPNDFKSFLMEVLNHPEKMGSIDEILHKSLTMYKNLVDSIKDASPEERKRIQESLVEISQFFNEQFETVSSKMGMSKEDMLVQMKNPANYSDNVWDSIKDFEKEVEKEKRLLVRAIQGNPTKESPSKKRKSTKKAAWVGA